MAARATWKGYLKLSSVSCAAALFPATTTRERVRFHIINRKTGHRVRYDVVDSGTGFKDRYETALKNLIAVKRAGRAPPAARLSRAMW